MNDLLPQLAATLHARHLTLATAESCTGGLVGATLTSLPGSSAWYLGGIVAYSNFLKIRLLAVPPLLLNDYGAVSPETARAMANGARDATGADFSISLTGIAGPDGGAAEKPVGLVFIAVASSRQILVFEHRFEGSRDHIRTAATQAALRHLLDVLNG